MSGTKERESYTISKDTWGDGDFTSEDQWEFEGETYVFMRDELVSGDGEAHRVICQRESDGKYFEFSWLYTYSQDYQYGNTLTEVFPKTITKTVYE
jgi:hypothetical protein